MDPTVPENVPWVVPSGREKPANALQRMNYGRCLSYMSVGIMFEWRSGNWLQPRSLDGAGAALEPFWFLKPGRAPNIIYTPINAKCRTIFGPHMKKKMLCAKKNCAKVK